jgi:hydrogenase maturation protease
MGETVASQAEASSGPNRRGSRDVLVLGLGNILLTDDGVGVHVVRHLARAPNRPAGLRPVDGGTLGFQLMPALVAADAVLVVDAAQFGEPGGSHRLFDQQALADHISRGRPISAHQAGLVDLLTLARLVGWEPARFALLGIQPQRIDWGEQLSETVAGSLPAVCRAVVRTVRAWHLASCRNSQRASCRTWQRAS